MQNIQFDEKVCNVMFLFLFSCRPMTQFNERVTIYQYMDATLNHPKIGQLQTRELIKIEMKSVDIHNRFDTQRWCEKETNAFDLGETSSPATVSLRCGERRN
jgi:hypothetical protein